MGEKKGGQGHDHGSDAAKKKDDGKVLNVVFKIEVHCEGCGSRIVKAARGLAGVESAKVDCDKNRLSVVGEVDPVKLRDRLESKLKKKVELVSPLPVQKDDQKQESKKAHEGEKKADENKSKEDKKPQAPISAVLKLHLHCDGCIEKVHHILSKTDDVESVSFDKQKDLVTVNGTMDVKFIREVLEKKMKRTVEIVPPKKSEGKDDGKEKEMSTDKKVEAAGDGGKQQAEFNRMMTMPMPMAAHPGYGYGNGYGYNVVGPGYPSYYPVQNVHAPQIFSDENPNACSVM